MKDWKGDTNSVLRTLGSGIIKDRHSEDYYATDPIAAEWLLKLETFSPNIWECACGAGHLSKVFEKHGYNVRSTDLIYRGYGKGGIDFLSPTITHWKGDIITNPPFKYAEQFVRKAMSIIEEGNKLALFLRILFLESKARKKLFKKYPPKVVYISSSRIKCGKNGNFDIYTSSAQAYAWFVWVKGYKGDTIIKWFN